MPNATMILLGRSDGRDWRRQNLHGVVERAQQGVRFYTVDFHSYNMSLCYIVAWFCPEVRPIHRVMAGGIMVRHYIGSVHNPFQIGRRMVPGNYSISRVGIDFRTISLANRSCATYSARIG